VEHPYPCDMCNKTFSESHYLKANQHVHTEERIAVRCVIKHSLIKVTWRYIKLYRVSI